MWNSHSQCQRNISNSPVPVRLAKSVLNLFRSAFPYVFFSALIILLTSCLTDVSAQDRAALESERKRLVEKIKLTESELSRTKTSKTNSLKALKTLGIKIRSRENLIETYKKEVIALEKRITENEGIISSLNEDIEQLKEAYAEMIVAAYKNKNNDNMLLFLFASQDFNDMLRRARYLKDYSEHRGRQYELIEKTKLDLEEKVSTLKENRNELKILLSEQTNQISILASEKDEKNGLLKSIEVNEASLKKELSQQRDEAKKLTQQIEKIIREELKKTTAAAGSNATTKSSKNKSTSSSTSYALTPEAQLISKNFSGNKGKLPWPVERGYVSESFGDKAHELRNNLKTSNNGIDIATSSDASVRAIFQGKVLNIVLIPGFQKALIIGHGEYFSVYANLKDVYVKKGESITTKQVLGLAHTDTDTGDTKVHLEIWKGTRQLDPALWILRK